MRKNRRKLSYLERLLPWFSLLVTGATLWFIFTIEGAALIVWELVAFIYVLSVFIISWLADTSEESNTQKTKVTRKTYLVSWAWWLPLITSIAGVYAAIVAMSANAQAKINTEASLVAEIAALGVALSWFILHTGFADVYAHIAAKHAKKQLHFPETAAPKHLDYLYFALTIGATFSTSDVTVLTTRMRRIVALHSVISFFYNALIVAVLFQVLQQLVTASV